MERKGKRMGRGGGSPGPVCTTLLLFPSVDHLGFLILLVVVFVV